MYGYSFNWLYGGGVNEDLVRNLSKSNIDGFVVGNNSLDVDKVVNMVNILNS